MRHNLAQRITKIACVTLFTALCALAQEHKWADRAPDDLESAIHERLATIPFHGVFDRLNFEVHGATVTLTGQVMNERVQQAVERAARKIDGVGRVINRIEVLPSSRRDDVLRMKVYSAIYENETLEKYGTRASPPIHIIVKNGWVTLEGVVDSGADRSTIQLRY